MIKLIIMSVLNFIIILIILIMPFGVGFSQESSTTNVPQTLSPESIGQGFKKAMKTIDAEKQRAEEELKSKLRLKFNEAVDDWISAKEQEKEQRLNKFIKQSWEDIPKYGPRGHYDYYLRGYDYQIISSDIIKTDSLVSPYSGRLSVVENLYAEIYHSPDVSYRDDFLYTVSTPINVHFEYNGTDFISTDIKYEDSSMVNGWPEDVKTEIFKKIF